MTPRKQAPVSAPKPKTGAKRKAVSKYVDESSEEEEEESESEAESEEEEPPPKKGEFCGWESSRGHAIHKIRRLAGQIISDFR